jgi:hypothetical protein
MSDVETVMVHARQVAAQSAALCELIGMLIEKGVLNQGDVMARYERLSQEMMKQKSPEGVHLADLIRDHAAGDPDGPKPS